MPNKKIYLKNILYSKELELNFITIETPGGASSILYLYTI